METKQPTKKQIKEFWKRCGYKALCKPDEYGVQAWRHSMDSRPTLSLPKIDLNNLFKYAVPKLQPEVIKIVPVIGVKKQFDYGERWACHLTLKGWSKTKA